MSLMETMVALLLVVFLALPLFTYQSTERHLISSLEEEVLMGALLEDVLQLFSDSGISMSAWRALRQTAGGDKGRLALQLLHPMVTGHATIQTFALRRQAVRKRLNPLLSAEIEQGDLAKIKVRLSWQSRLGATRQLSAERIVLGDLSRPPKTVALFE